MSEAKKYIESLDDEKRKSDSLRLLSIMQKASTYKPVLAGKLIAYGSYHYKYDSGREGDACVTGFAPRKQHLVVYIMPGFSAYGKIMDSLGKFKTGKSCLYIKKLEDIDLDALSELVALSCVDMRKKYACE